MSNLVAACVDCNIGKHNSVDTRGHVGMVRADSDLLAEVFELQRQLDEAQEKINALVRQIELADEPSGVLTSVGEIVRAWSR